MQQNDNAEGNRKQFTEHLLTPAVVVNKPSDVVNGSTVAACSLNLKRTILIEYFVPLIGKGFAGIPT